MGWTFRARKVSDPEAQKNFDQLASFLGSGTKLTRVTALPSAPADGDEYTLVVDTKTEWHIKYRSDTGKWSVLGGPPLYAEQTNYSSTDATTNTAFVAPPTNAGPSVTIPFAGDYDVTVAGQIVGKGALSYQIGVTVASDDDSVTTATTSANELQEVTRRKTGLAAGTGLNARIRSVDGASTQFMRRRLRAMPARLG